LRRRLIGGNEMLRGQPPRKVAEMAECLVEASHSSLTSLDYDDINLKLFLLITKGLERLLLWMLLRFSALC
jgi:hypothetical protein